MVHETVAYWAGAIMIYTGGIALLVCCVALALYGAMYTVWRRYRGLKTAQFVRDACEEKHRREGTWRG